MKKYTYINSTDNVREVVLSDVAPTECLNNAHTFDAISLTVSPEDVLVNDGTPVHQQATLAAYKQLRYNEINGKSWGLKDAGFVYDSSTFGLSVFAMVAYEDMLANPTKYTFPYTLSTKDNNTYSLAEANLEAFVDAARNTVKGHKESGNALLKSVFDAVDRAATDLVIDNR